MALYDQIGQGYRTTRRSDPEINRQIAEALAGATDIVNIGAGAGSYEPPHIKLVAVEPSSVMIAQRPLAAHPVVQAAAEDLPFADQSFSHALAVLSMHHWHDKKRAFQEVRRVARDRFVALTYVPDAVSFWLTADYFPEINENDRAIFPTLADLEAFFGPLTVTPLMVPEGCMDGFLGAFWKRPEAYLLPRIRAGISAFSALSSLQEGLDKLQRDLESGVWHSRYSHLAEATELDVGYRLVSIDLGR